MDKTQQEVYDRIALHLEYRKATRIMPIHILHHEIQRFMRDDEGLSSEQVNKALNGLYAEGVISVGKTINYTYITFPQYVDQVNAKLNK